MGNTEFSSLARFFRLFFRPHVLKFRRSPCLLPNLAHPQHSARSHFPDPGACTSLSPPELIPPHLSPLCLSHFCCPSPPRYLLPCCVNGAWLFPSFLQPHREVCRAPPGWPAGFGAVGSRLQFVSHRVDSGPHWRGCEGTGRGGLPAAGRPEGRGPEGPSRPRERAALHPASLPLGKPGRKSPGAAPAAQ